MSDTQTEKPELLDTFLGCQETDTFPLGAYLEKFR